MAEELRKEIIEAIDRHLESALSLSETAVKQVLDHGPCWRFSKALHLLKWLVSGHIFDKLEHLSIEDQLSAHRIISEESLRAMD